jgi:hypothetical protein
MNLTLLAEMPQSQLLMLAGFVMLGWVLARRQIRMRRRVHTETAVAEQAIARLRDHKAPSLPLCDAPPQTQRWQAAMFDLQRELKADLDTRIVIVQTLLRQVDERIASLSSLQANPGLAAPPALATMPVAAPDRQRVEQLLHRGHTAAEIAQATGLPLGDVEMTIATIRVG